MNARTSIAGAALGLLLLHGAARGQQPAGGGRGGVAVATPADAAPFWPGAVYDPAIPTLRSVLGHGPGEQIVSPDEAIRYLEALQSAAPKRMRIVEYGRTWENRPLVYAVIASEANLARLDTIKQGMERLADPRRTEGDDADVLIRDLPAVVWLGYGIHGDEISSTDAALYTAYHLLAAREDEIVSAGLASAVVVIDPSQNPDGRNRFVQSNRAAVGNAPSSSPIAAERDQPWPGGRFNHYLFDLNRDLIALTQPESRARVKALLEWYPLVVVDAHEMGAESTYFFPPNAEPSNPHITSAQQAALELFGRNNARWFDRFGFGYFTREVFDFFYPGYADTWATFQGGVGMTYEQASARGLEVRRPSGGRLTYADGVRHHFVASMSTIESAATNRDRLLRDFWEYRKSAIEEGRRGSVREHVLPRRGDASLVDELGRILLAQGIEVRRSTRAITDCRQELPAGSLFVSTAQPAGRFANTLLETGAAMQEPFVREQERRRRKNLPHEVYDITAWSLPLLFGVEHLTCGEEAPGASLEPLIANAGAPAPVAQSASARETSAAVAYVVPWGSVAAGRFLVEALEREELAVFGADAGFTLGGRAYPRGTLIVRAGEEAATGSLASTVALVAKSTGAEAVATDTTWTESGISLASDKVLALRQPRIALAWDAPTSPTAAGALRWVLEQRLGLELTAVRTRTLAGADLSEFDVLVLPDGEGWSRVLGEGGAQRLKRFVDEGGVVVAIGGAVTYLADDEVALLTVEQEKRAKSATEPAVVATATPTPTPTTTPKGQAAPAAAAPSSDESESGGGTILRSEADYLKAIGAKDASPDEVPGAIVRTVPDPDHWLTVGLGEAVNVMVQGSAIYAPLRLDQGTNALHYAAANDLVVSGYLWSENREQLAWKPFTMIQQHGRGFVIGFTADPAFRGVLAGADVLLLNAIVRAPAHVERQ